MGEEESKKKKIIQMEFKAIVVSKWFIYTIDKISQVEGKNLFRYPHLQLMSWDNQELGKYHLEQKRLIFMQGVSHGCCSKLPHENSYHLTVTNGLHWVKIKVPEGLCSFLEDSRKNLFF